jgi:hypothetical protein
MDSFAKDGKPLEIELMIAAGGGFADQFVSVIKEDFARTGISSEPAQTRISNDAH